LDFGSFALPAIDLRTPMQAAAGEEKLCSLRPQSVAISGDRSESRDLPGFAGKITARTYLGEYWDYTVCSDDGNTTLRVSSGPLQVHDVGEQVWLAIDTRQVAVVEGPA